MAKVILDAGHGGNDAGDIFMNRTEKDDDLRLTLAIGKILEELGIEVVYTRTEDINLSQMERVKKVNEEGADLLVSVHRVIGEISDGSPTMSFFTFAEGGLPEETALNIAKELEELNFVSTGIIIRRDLPLLKDTEMPAVIIGIGNLNSEAENEFFDKNFDEIAALVARGIANSIKVTGMSNNLDIQSDYLNPEREGSNIMNEGTDYYYIQMGLFANYNNALNLQNQLMSLGYPAMITIINNLYAVIIGCFTDLDYAAEFNSGLRFQGFDTLLVRQTY